MYSEGKVRFTLITCLGKALRGSRGIAVLFPDLGVGRGWVVSDTPRPLYRWERDPMVIVQEAV